MKTYTKTTTIQRPMLEITFDHDAESPRKYDNLGYFVTNEKKYKSPDGNDNVAYNAMMNTEYHAMNTEHHMELIEKDMETAGEKVLAIYPVMCYEHGNISYRIGKGAGFDISNCGFYIVTEETAKLLGTPKKHFKKIIEQELEDYTNWVNGDIYEYILYDEDGDVVDSCGGFYDIRGIKNCLPDEWQSENIKEYFISNY